jgi:DNA polymerase-3 subunit delta'
MSVFAPWQQRAYLQALAALVTGRLTHALLICGPEGLGKLALADALAQRLLCRAPSDGHACGHCKSCHLMAAGTHPDRYVETLEPNEKGDLRSEIAVSQIRRLGERLTLTPQIGQIQVALVFPAELMNRSAFNALLKTLEEPPPGRYLILVSDHPYRLPATIRSRCQRLDVRLPARDEASAWLQVMGAKAEAIDEALDAAQGNPGLAKKYLDDDALALRRVVADDLVALATGRRTALTSAQAWMADRPALRLRFAASLVRDHLGFRLGTVGDPDALSRAGLAHTLDPRQTGDWFDRANAVLNWLRVPLRQDLQLVDLLRQWQAACVKMPPLQTMSVRGG